MFRRAFVSDDFQTCPWTSRGSKLMLFHLWIWSEVIIRTTDILTPLVITMFCTKRWWSSFLDCKVTKFVFAHAFSARGILSNVDSVGPAPQIRRSWTYALCAFLEVHVLGCLSGGSEIASCNIRHEQFDLVQWITCQWFLAYKPDKASFAMSFNEQRSSRRFSTVDRGMLRSSSMWTCYWYVTSQTQYIRVIFRFPALFCVTKSELISNNEPECVFGVRSIGARPLLASEKALKKRWWWGRGLMDSNIWLRRHSTQSTIFKYKFLNL